MEPLALGMRWEPDRPRILVAACSDGRLQVASLHVDGRDDGGGPADRATLARRPGGW